MLPNELLQEICLYLDEMSLFHLSRLHKVFHQHRTKYVDSLYVDSYNLNRYCQEGRILSVLELLSQDSMRPNWERGIQTASGKGHYEIVKLLIDKLVDGWNGALFVACENGHKRVAVLLIDAYHRKGLQEKLFWESGLMAACIHGDPETIDLIIKNGGNSWSSGLYGATMGGHMGLVNRMILLGADNWDEGLYNACERGHFEIAKLMIDKGATDIARCFDIACGSNVEIVSLLAERYDIGDVDMLLEGVKTSVYKNRADILKFLVFKMKEMKIDLYQDTLNLHMYNACWIGNYDVVKLLLHFGPIFSYPVQQGDDRVLTVTNFDKALSIAEGCGHHHIVAEILKYYTPV